MISQFEGDTGDEVWRKAAAALSRQTAAQDSRGGVTRELLHCQLHIRNPRQRWVLSRLPAMNPAFAIAEFIWILQGRNDAAFVNFWNPALPKFAGRDENYYGAYGHRLRVSHGVDQLDRAYHALKNNPDSRQVVLQIWNAPDDLPRPDGSPPSQDIPCNICSLLKVRHGRLEWTQIMRSNDLYRGTPHNLVQFTTLHEVMAGWLNLKVGSFVLWADSLHVYKSDTELRVTPTAPDIRNTDNLALPREKCRCVLTDIEAAMDELRETGLTQERFQSIVFNRSDLPQSWLNLLCIVAADAARRREWTHLMKAAAESCTNMALIVLWERWVGRQSKYA